MDLVVSTAAQDGATVVGVRGAVDLRSCEELRERLFEVIDDGAPNVVVDFDGVHFCDSSGLGVLVAAYKRARASGGSLVLTGTHSRVQRLLRITGLEKVLVPAPAESPGLWPNERA